MKRAYLRLCLKNDEKLIQAVKLILILKYPNGFRQQMLVHSQCQWVMKYMPFATWILFSVDLFFRDTTQRRILSSTDSYRWRSYHFFMILFLFLNRTFCQILLLYHAMQQTVISFSKMYISKQFLYVKWFHEEFISIAIKLKFRNIGIWIRHWVFNI